MSNEQEIQTHPSGTKKNDIGLPKGCLIFFSLLGIGWLYWLVYEVKRFAGLSKKVGFFNAFTGSPSFEALLCLSAVIVGFVVYVRRVEYRKKRYPQEPWMWYENWNRNGTAVALPTGAADAAWLAVYGCGAALIVGICIFYFTEFHIPVLAGIPFFLAAVFVLILAIRQWLPILRGRRLFFRYRTFPFFLGSTAEGLIEGIDAIKAFDLITATLQCIRWRSESKITYRGYSRIEIIEEILHEQRQDLQPDHIRKNLIRSSDANDQRKAVYRQVLPISFELPTDMPETTSSGGPPLYKWQLKVQITAGGNEYHGLFVLPVYNKPPQFEHTA